MDNTIPIIPFNIVTYFWPNIINWNLNRSPVEVQSITIGVGGNFQNFPRFYCYSLHDVAWEMSTVCSRVTALHCSIPCGKVISVGLSKSHQHGATKRQNTGAHFLLNQGDDTLVLIKLQFLERWGVESSGPCWPVWIAENSQRMRKILKLCCLLFPFLPSHFPACSPHCPQWSRCVKCVLMCLHQLNCSQYSGS